MNLPKIAGTHSFAFLAGLGRKPAASAPAAAKDGDEEEEDEPDEKRKRKDGESDDDYAKRMKALDDEEVASKKKGAGDDEHDDDDEDEAGDDVKRAERRGARKMQARIAQILSTEAASRNIAQAAELACSTTLSAEKVEAILQKGGAAASGLGSRMDARQRAPIVPPGGGGDLRGADAIARSWDAAAAPFKPKSS